MASQSIPTRRILERLDGHLNKNDYAAAEEHLLYWRAEAQKTGDRRAELLVQNELMGLYRKLGQKKNAMACVEAALEQIRTMGIGHQVGAATTLLNCATVCKAFEMAEQSILLFEQARAVYEKELDPADSRLGGLYNNMALTLVDLKRFAEAKSLYQKAISIMERAPEGDLEMAITYLNLASAAEAELGLEEANEPILSYLEQAEALLEKHTNRDGYYAFVCEKCASVFEYYGSFFYAKELLERARRIYEGT